MKPKTIKWKDPIGSNILSTDDIPEFLYRIQELTENYAYKLYFIHGYSPLQDRLIGYYPTIEEAKKAAQNHWDAYVMKNFIE